MQTTAVFSEIANSNNHQETIAWLSESWYLCIRLITPPFLQIPNILLHHEGFLEDLKSRLENWDAKKTIGDWFLECVRMSRLPPLSYN